MISSRDATCGRATADLLDSSISQSSSFFDFIRPAGGTAAGASDPAAMQFSSSFEA
jgi:hypothetical protein